MKKEKNLRKKNLQKIDGDLWSLRHSLSHILAAAVLELFPNSRLGVGPTIEKGFYHDFMVSGEFSVTDLQKLENKMRQILKKRLDFTKSEETINKGIDFLKKRNQPYTLEIAKDLKKKGVKKISFFRTGNFINMCEGPHLKNTKEIDPSAFKLTKIAGAYWRGNEKKPMLTRIYGVAFKNEGQLREFERKTLEMEQRDHRKLGQELDLFTFSNLIGKGLPLFTKYGATIRRELERAVVDEEIKRGYDHVCTPDLASVELYKKSGHYPYYQETMYPPLKIDEEEMMLRPMSCPHHIMLYAAKPRSYRELPLRFAEIVKLYRYEKSGELTGLLRVRGFCLADAHIFVTPKQAAEEIKQVINLIEFFCNIFGLKRREDYCYRLSLGDRTDKKKYYSDDASWEQSEKILRTLLQEINAPFQEAKGEAAFYGPKIDVQMKNIAGKEETAFTVQYDFCLPKRFEIFYIDDKGKKQTPILIHRSSIGAIERIIAFLIEHFAGAFPLWLAPVQIAIIPVGKNHQEFAKQLKQDFFNSSFRVEVDDQNETVGNKIRKAIKMKIPYILVVGDKEVGSEQLMVRQRGKKEILSFSKKDFIDRTRQLIEKRSLDL